VKRTLSLSKSQVYWLHLILGSHALVLVEMIDYTFVLAGPFQWLGITSFSQQATYVYDEFCKKTALYFNSTLFAEPENGQNIDLSQKQRESVRFREISGFK
jgi:hypothetical protein